MNLELAPADVNNLWRHWWAAQMSAAGGRSLLPLAPLSSALQEAMTAPAPELARELPELARELPELPPELEPEPEPEPEPKPNRAMRRFQAHTERKQQKAEGRPRAPRKPRVRPSAEPVEPVQERPPLNLPPLPREAWAQELLGDYRTNSMTLDHLLEGLDNYFDVFGRLRRVGGDAYHYFARVGTPVITNGHSILKRALLESKIRDPSKLPSMFGVFLPESDEEFLRKSLAGEETYFDFHYFTKIKHAVTAAPLDTAIYEHNLVSSQRNVFTKRQAKKFPWARSSWGARWYVGVLPDGTVRALPQRMGSSQRLPSGDRVHRSAFEIPRGLRDGGLNCDRDPHAFVSKLFIGMAVLTASCLSGLQVTIKRGGLAMRFGIPITHAKQFFADRLPEEGATRRRPILHLRPAHRRQLADGRIVIVGDHLAGQRIFDWRGYQVLIAAPGIHLSPAETFTEALYTDSGDYATGMPPRDDQVPMGEAAGMIGKTWWDPRGKPRFEHGKLATGAWDRDGLIDVKPEEGKP